MNLTSKRKSIKKIYEPIGVIFAKTHITPNVITIISVIVGVFSAVAFYNQKPLTGAILLFILFHSASVVLPSTKCIAF